MFKINLITFKFNKMTTIFIKTMFCGQIIFEERLYAVHIRNMTKFAELQSSEHEFHGDGIIKNYTFLKFKTS